MTPAHSYTEFQVNDFNCGLKAYKNEVVKNVDVYGEMHRYIPVLAKNEDLLKLVKKQYNIKHENTA